MQYCNKLVEETNYLERFALEIFNVKKACCCLNRNFRENLQKNLGEMFVSCSSQLVNQYITTVVLECFEF